ncbi:MAG TPA: hypothetical protein GXX34_11505 [Clostridia bacterium]|nr:hypothetical protein [Clostridia bacterium]
MTMGFWRGMIAGGIIGGLMSKWFGKPLKKVNMEDMSHKISELRGRAEKAMHEAKDGVKGIARKK